MSAGDTIFAVASGSGMAALAVIRVSGREAAVLLAALAGRCPAPRMHTVSTLRHPNSNELLDQAVIVWLPGPGTYTGEDCAELFVHAGRSTVFGLLDAIGSIPGCRPADAGEFTRRAVLNGKMDLVEAEGLGDLLSAETSKQRRQALMQLTGEASSVFDGWRQRLILIRSNIEAVLDFADEAGVAEAALPEIDNDIRELLAELMSQQTQSQQAQAIREGVRVVLAGHPNTGKSSLLNAIAGREAAIVSAIPGTTRDVIEVKLDIGGIPVMLMDTAGLRQSEDEIEREGVRRAEGRIAESDVSIWVCSPDISGSEMVWPGLNPDLIVYGKSDLNDGNISGDNVWALSSRTGEGIAEFLNGLSAVLDAKFRVSEHGAIVTARQKSCVLESIRALNDSLLYDSERLELKAVDIQRAADHIGRLTGRVDVEEWLGAIFSRFCIGK